MKKFTFIATLMLAFASLAHAELMDKYFFKIPTDKNPGWYIQDGTNTVMTYGKDYLEVQQKKNAGRMLSYFFNEEAWSKQTIDALPNKTYKFTMDMKMTNMAASRTDMEFTLLPVNACTSTNTTMTTHNYHWVDLKDQAGNDSVGYFFRFRVVTGATEANGDFTIMINENPTARNNWPTTTNADSLCTLSSQKLYKFVVVINPSEKTATYSIADEAGAVVKTGVHKYASVEDRVGIMCYSTQGLSTAQLSNMGLCYEAEGPFANEPTADLLACRGTERDYYATFGEGETLHWIQLGNATDALGNAFEDGQEYSVAYGEANDKRDFEQDAENYFGSKIIYCTKSGDLKMWTTRTDDETNKSDETVVAVTCEQITMPTPVASITNVAEGYAKTYTITADNSSTLLTPTVTINCKMSDGTVKTLASGETITLDKAGSFELYSYDGTHPTPWYGQSETVTVNNSVEYVTCDKKDYAWTKEVCDGTVEGFTKTEIVDNSNKSHWDRIYSDQKYGYDKDGNAEVYVEGTEYVSTKEGFKFYAGTAIGTDDAKWNVQVPNDVYTGFAPLIPAENTSYTANAWAVFPLEGIVYYATNITNLTVNLDSKYTSDDANKPNFFIVHTRGGYDRPDKGDCNATTVCVAGESYSLYRYDTAICDVTIMTYKGFVPSETGIASVAADQTSAPAVKKMVTKNGIVIVKGNNTYNVAGAQIK